MKGGRAIKLASRFTAVMAVAVLFAPLALAQVGRRLNLTDAKGMLKIRAKVRPGILVEDDANLRACKAFQNAKDKANAAYLACMDTDNPPAGSPLASFNAMSNVQLGQYCGAMTLEQCVDKALTQQETFCQATVKPLEELAARKKSECGEALKECLQAKKELVSLERVAKLLAAKKAQLESELAKVNADLAKNATAVEKAQEEVTKQCTVEKARK